MHMVPQVLATVLDDAAAVDTSNYPQLLSALIKSQTLTQKLYRRPEPSAAVAGAATAALRRYCQQQQAQAAAAAAAASAAAGGTAAAGGGRAPQTAAAAASGIKEGKGSGGLRGGGGGASSSSSSGSGDEEKEEERGPMAGTTQQQQQQLPLMDAASFAHVRAAVHALVTWRDAVAREVDEGVQWVLPEGALLDLAHSCSVAAAAAGAAAAAPTAPAAVAAAAAPPAAAATAPAPAAAGGGGVSSAVSCTAVTPGAAACTADGSSSSSSSSPACMVHAGLPKTERDVLAVIERQVDALNMQLVSVNPYGQQYRVSLVAKERVTVLLKLLREVAAGKLHAPEGFGAEAEAAMVVGHSGGGGSSSSSRVTGRKKRTEEQERDRREKMIKKFSAKNQVYENCRMLAQNGELLCYCDTKKVAWYLERGIAEKVGEEPPTIRLLFEHKNADQQAGLDGFYSQSKTNQCVVCGEDGHYLR